MASNIFTFTVLILPGGGQNKEESVRPPNCKADRSKIQIHRTDENNEEYAKIYNRGTKVGSALRRKE